MPELPEVENVRRGLQRLVKVGSRSKSITLHREDLRFPFPAGLQEKMRGQTILGIHRRAKYLVFETDKYLLISHLGMTGSWRELDQAILHDHLHWQFVDGPTLVFNDPRRFGFVSLYEKTTTPAPFVDLGPEPLGEEFTADYLQRVSRGKKQPLKSFFLDQKVVAGLGNIYVCEALFAARLSPTKLAGRLTKENCLLVIKVIRKILATAIEAGGSTIRDYRNAEGKAGDFQTRFKVYGRDGEPCRRCRTKIRVRRISGRSTFWCPQCQK